MNLSGKVYSKTGKGVQALSSKSRDLSSDSLKILASIDGKTDAETLMEQFVKLPDDAFITMVSQLEADGYIRFIKNKDWEFDDDDIGASSAMVVDELSPEDFFALTSQAAPENKTPPTLEPKSAASKTNEMKVSSGPITKSKAGRRTERSSAKGTRAKADEVDRQEAERKAQEKAEHEAKVEAEQKASDEVERKAREDAERKEVEAEVIAKAANAAKLAAERLMREEEEARQKAEAEARARAETEARLEAERVAREEEARKQEEVEKRAKAEHEAKLEAERKAQEEAERKARDDAERKARQEEEARQKAETEARAKAEKEARLEAERVAKEEAKRKADEEKALRQKAKEEERAIAAELAREKAEQKARERAERKAEKEAQRALRPPLDLSKWLSTAKKSLLYSPLILMVLFVLLHVVNLRMLADPIEMRLSEVVGEPVNIREVRISLFPSAHLTLSGIAIGKRDEADIGLIRMPPMVLMQSDGAIDIHTLEIEGVTMNSANAANQMKWLSAVTDKNKLSVDEVLIKDITMNIPGLELASFSARVIVPASGGLDLITLESNDKRLKISLVPANEGYKVKAYASAWQVPLSRLQFTELNAEGFADSEQVYFDRITGQIYGGTLTASLTVNWANQSKASGDFVLNAISLPVALSSMETNASIDGTLSAKGTVVSESMSVGELVNALEIKAVFTALNGKINGVNLAGPMLSGGDRDSVTRFDKLTGSLKFKDGLYQYRQLVLDRTQFKARGNLDIQPNQDIAGKVSGELVTSSRVIRSNLNLSGKVGNVKVN